MMQRGSISSRLTRELALWIGVLWLGMCVGVTLYIQHEIDEACDESLITSARRLLDLAAHEVGEMREHASGGTPVVLGRIEADPASHLDLRSLTYQILSMSGEVLLRSADAPAENLSASSQTGFTQTKVWRVYSLRHPTESIYIHVADSIAHRNAERRDSVLLLVLPLLAAFPAIAWLIRRITRRSLAPIEGLVAEIARRGVTNMEPVGGTGLPVEMQQICESTNHLLMRLKEALDVERSLAANAAHELRTPLAAARLRLANALDHSLPETARIAMDEAAASLERLARRAEKLLQMSRAESTAALAHETVDLGRLACDVAQEFWRDPDASRRLKVHLATDTPILTVGDADALAIAMRNLIENALRYAPGASVKITVKEPAVVVVRDLGAGVDEATLRAMGARHVRRTADQSGFGLGLSIVKTVVERHGGTMKLFSPAKGHQTGLSVVLTFVAAPADSAVAKASEPPENAAHLS